MTLHLLRFIFVLLITIVATVALDRRIGMTPPIGRFLDPFNGFWQNAETRQAKLSPEVEIEGLKGNVQVVYDDRFVPHLFAENDNDLFMLQGYVTAQHRLWQMEFQTYAAAGRICEIIGERAMDHDRWQRRKGMGFGAENAYKAMMNDPVTKASVEAYARGVNAYINSLSYKDFPFEYKLLNYSPKEWTPVKTALLLKLMADDLSGHDVDFENTAALKLFGKEYFDLLYPDRPAGQSPVVNAPGYWNFTPLKADSTMDNSLSRAFAKQPLPLIQSPPKPDPGNGSNNWAVSGSKTASGNPILCNDPHLALNLPSIWYEIQLTAPGVHVYGVTLPGAMNVIIGFNDSIAWGVTNARRDLVDWYKIEFKDKSKNEYRYGNEWRKTTKRIEEIRVYSGATVYDTVYYTHLGPVSYDESFSPGKSIHKMGYARRWIAHDASLEAMAFYKLNRSRNYKDYVAAIANYESPAQNFIFASVSNDIAMRVQGKFPVKWKEQGKFIMDGANPAHAWQAYIPVEHNVASYNPIRGFVSSANQHPADTTYPYYVYDNTYEYYRNRRINRVLDSARNVTPQDMMKLQNDNFNMMASESLPYFLAQLDYGKLSEAEKEAYNTLKGWDFFSNPDVVAPAYYEAWIDSLSPMLWDEFDHKELPLSQPPFYQAIHLLKTRPDFEIIDNKATPEKENAMLLLRKSFSKAVNGVAGWKKANPQPMTWANAKATSLQHVARQAALSVQNVHIGGNHNIVNATSSRHGASWRMVVELDKKGVKAWGVYPGGQSGNPGSPYYINMVDHWAKGQYYPLLFLASPSAGNNEQVLFRQVFKAK